MTTLVLNTKLSEVENKIPDVSGLVNAPVLSAKIREVENKIPDVSGLVKETDFDAKISDIEVKYLTASDYNKYMSDILSTKIIEKGLVDKSSISNLKKNSDLNTKVATLATKAELKTEQDKIVKFQAFDSSCFHGKSHFEDDDTENYLVFCPVYRYF